MRFVHCCSFIFLVKRLYSGYTELVPECRCRGEQPFMIKPATRRRIFEIIQVGNTRDLPSRAFDIVLVCAIILNISVLLLGTFDQLAGFSEIFNKIEFITVAFFCFEYILRIWTSDFLYPGRSKLESALRFIRSFDGVVDLMTILPFFWMSGFVAFRMLRVVRIFHLFRVNSYYDSFNVITSVIYEKRNQLASSIFIILVLMTASSLCMYSAEHDAQPEAFANAFSGLWWSVSAMLTVGYGDIYPITTTGRILAIIIAFLGVGVVAIPTGIISAGFVEQYTKAQNAAQALETSINTVLVDIDSMWLGKSAAEIEAEYHQVIAVVRRGDALMQPGEDYRVQIKDVLAVYRKTAGTV